MGQKIHPIGFRVGVIRSHDSHWIYPKSKYRNAVESDNKIRKFVGQHVPKGLVSRVEIERAAQKVRVNIWTSRPGAIIGRQGKGVDTLTQELNKLVQKDDPTAVVHVNVDEVRQPELDAQLVAENIAVQLERRISHRRAMRQAITRVQRLNGRGVKILVSGRLNASDIARSEGDMIGKVPLHTIRADIDYGQATAATVAGSVGIKVWIYKGEILSPRDRVAEMPAPRRERRPRAPRGEGGFDRGDRPRPQDSGGGYGQSRRRDYSERPRGPRPTSDQGGARPESQPAAEEQKES